MVKQVTHSFYMAAVVGIISRLASGKNTTEFNNYLRLMQLLEQLCCNVFCALVELLICFTNLCTNTRVANNQAEWAKLVVIAN